MNGNSFPGSIYNKKIFLAKILQTTPMLDFISRACSRQWGHGSLLHVKTTVSVTKSLHQDHGPCYLHLHSFSLYIHSTLSNGWSTVTDRRNSVWPPKSFVERSPWLPISRCNNDFLIILKLLLKQSVILCNRQIIQTKSMTVTLNKQEGIPTLSVII